jgi:hypothetical protein
VFAANEKERTKENTLEWWRKHRPTFAHLFQKYAEVMGKEWTLSDKKITVMEYAHFFNSVWFREDYLREPLLKTARQYIDLCRETLLSSLKRQGHNNAEANKHYSDLIATSATEATENRDKNDVFAWVDSADRDRDLTTTFFAHLREIYDIREKTNTTSESLARVLAADCGQLLHDMMKFILQYLVTPEKLVDESMTPSIEDGSEASSAASSTGYTARLSKIYTSLEKLKRDNRRRHSSGSPTHPERPVIVDPELDDTPYALYSEEYEPRKPEFADPEKFRAFLLQNLRDREQVADPHLAATIVDAWLSGNRAVEPGDYAILDETPETIYSDFSQKTHKKHKIFKRSSDGTAWIAYDGDEGDKKQIMEQYRRAKRKTPVSQLLSPTFLKESVKRSMKELAHALSQRINARVRILAWKNTIDNEQQVRVSRLLSTQGVVAGEVVAKKTESPFEGLRQKILSEPDFAMRQYWIKRFYVRFCRDAAPEGEDVHWGYCRETNAPLFPRSLYELAVAFSVGNYGETLDRIIARIGKKSEDGEAVIDQHTNYVLKRLDDVVEEEFDENGFKVVSRTLVENKEMMEEDEEDDFAAIIGDDIMENPVAQKVIRVFRVLKKMLGLPANNETVEKMVVSQSLRILCQGDQLNTLFFMDADEFEKEREKKREKDKEREKKRKLGKGQRQEGDDDNDNDDNKERADYNYTHYTNRNIICVTLAMFLVAIQTAMPPLRPRLSVPGCIYSYGGFPLTGNSDMSGLEFLSCFLLKYSKQGDQGDIWKAIHSPFTAERMTRLAANILSVLLEKIQDVPLTEAYNRKRLYLLKESQRSVPESLGRWSSFLPPLVKYTIEHKMTRGKTIAARTGGSVEKYRAQSLMRGYATVENIRTIVAEESLLLPNVYLQNACCHDNQDTHPLTFFTKRNEVIRADMAKIAQNDILIQSLDSASIHSPMLFFATGTKAAANSHANEAVNSPPSKNLIYAAFIHYCRYDYDELPDADCAELCKPLSAETRAAVRAAASLEEKIAVLEEASIFHNTPEQLHELMARVSRRIPVGERGDRSQDLRALLQINREDGFAMIEESVATAAEAFLASENDLPTQKHYSIDLIDAASNAIDEKHAAISRFLSSMRSNNNRTLNETLRFLETVKREPKMLANEDAAQNHRFVKNAVYEILDCFTHQVLHHNDPFKREVAAHWGFSASHAGKLADKLNGYYLALHPFMSDDDEEQATLLRDYLREVVPRLRALAEWVDILSVTSVLSSPAVFHILLKYIWFTMIHGLIERAVDAPVSRRLGQYLQAILSIEAENRETMNYDYDRIRAEVFKTREKEKLAVIERIGNLNRFEKGVDKLQRKLKLGDYYVDPEFYKNPDFMEMRRNGVVPLGEDAVNELAVNEISANEIDEYGYDQADPDYGGQYEGDGGDDGEVGF